MSDINSYMTCVKNIILCSFNNAGINVGHQFFSRVEMVAVGLHGLWLSGIDYIGESCKMVVCFYLFSGISIFNFFCISDSILTPFRKRIKIEFKIYLLINELLILCMGCGNDTGKVVMINKEVLDPLLFGGL